MDDQSVWKDRVAVNSFITQKRAAIPNAVDQINAMLHILRHSGKPIKSFVDLGAGDGILSQLILEQFSGAYGVAVDFSEPMIEAAHKKLADYSDRIKIVEADISSSEWQQAVFMGDFEKTDAIVSGYCIHHLSHGRKYELYQEIYDRLENGGLFINIEHVASKSDWGELLSDEAFIDMIISYEKNARPRRQVSEEFHDRPDKKDNILLSVDVQCEWLRLLGFQEVDVFFKSFELAVFGGKKV
ncbi:MAG: class I SAM-dependent methyltransferase [Firmicutes bacterium]|nr:class I SAM-dependent methyltransferase [Bacillota bacterium]